MSWRIGAAAIVVLSVSTGASAIGPRSADLDVPAACPVTRADPSFMPPAPYPALAPYGRVWIGTSALWVSASADGVWRGIRRETVNGPTVANKQFWWRAGYFGPSEPAPRLVVTGRRLDAVSAPITVGPATNAYHRDFGGWTMLVSPEIPSGCWELTGEYGSDRVSFVVWAPE